MTAPSDNRVEVAYPASPRFRRLGRVTVAGLALRLGFDVARVENLRTAVDVAGTALGDDGRVVVEATWSDDRLELTLQNDTAALGRSRQEALEKELLAYCDASSVTRDRVVIGLDL